MQCRLDLQKGTVGSLIIPEQYDDFGHQHGHVATVSPFAVQIRDHEDNEKDENKMHRAELERVSSREHDSQEEGGAPQ